MIRSLALFVMLAGGSVAQASDYPLTVRSCEREVTFSKAPHHVVSHDLNMTDMLLALGLRERMAGFTGISGWKTIEPELRAKLDGLAEIAPRHPSVENLLDVGADLYFAGWNYGMRVGGPVTPQTLAPFGIAVYELSESCSFVMTRREASFSDLYNDLANLGRIFSVETRAQALIEQTRQRVQQVQTALGDDRVRPRVFLYDSGEDRPMTSGRLGMPQALIHTAGGHNVMDDVTGSWITVNWESVVERNPQVIVIVDYGPTSWQAKRDFLLQHPALQSVEAIRNKRFAVLSYIQATPSLHNAQALEILARALHPQAFAEASR
ncbi:ABC transporter substrate-binding protein [Pseudomonas sp. 3A(2025)]